METTPCDACHSCAKISVGCQRGCGFQRRPETRERAMLALAKSWHSAPSRPRCPCRRAAEPGSRAARVPQASRSIWSRVCSRPWRSAGSRARPGAATTKGKAVGHPRSMTKAEQASQLIFKRAPIGWNDDDYDVLADGKLVGRIFKVPIAPQDRTWDVGERP